MFGNLFGKKINVKFINAADGQVFAQTDLDAEQLPETFELDTVMHIGDEDWSVEEAIPATAAEFKQTKKLVLRLRKVEYMNPQDIKYSLPTVSSDFPPLSEASLFDDFEEIIHEDDWRQNEFLSASEMPLINAEIREIMNIRENESTNVDGQFYSFNKLHVREKVAHSDLKIEYSKLKSLLKIEKSGRIKVEKNHGFVENGFALKTDSAVYYGIMENDFVARFCMKIFSEDSIDEILALNKAFKLVFVNWCACDIIGETEPSA